MKINKIQYLVAITILVSSCINKPKSFSLLIANYQIQFPITSAELRKRYPRAVETHLTYLTDTTKKAVQIVWRFKNSLEDPRRQPYGVLITLKNKADKMDSIRTALEKTYAQPFIPKLQPEYLGKYEFYEKDPSLGVMQINDDVQLSISRKKIWPAGGYQFTDDVIIAICYDLDDTEKERFAMKQGDIHVRD